MSLPAKRLVPIPHLRYPWVGDETVHVCVRWGWLKGTDESVRFREASEADYIAAKTNGDFDAAARVVASCVERGAGVIDLIVDTILPFARAGTPLLCVVPHPSFDDEDGSQEDTAFHRTPRNVLPLAYANFLAEMIGADVDEEILERERIGRTKLTALERFLWQPSFVGAVRKDAVYLLVDDVFTLGGTLAALRSHIVMNGGIVAVATALAHRSGKGGSVSV